MSNPDFDQLCYWQRRLEQDIDLGVVGQRSLGRGYNEYIYLRRVEVLVDILERMDIDLAAVSVLDIGCGSGYYLRFWEAQRTRKLCGLDVSQVSIDRLRSMFSCYRFIKADITCPTTSAEINSRFSLITFFDVLYHIPDDDKALAALTNIRECLLPDGYLLVFDQLLKSDYSMLAHVKFRGRSAFSDLLDRAGLVLEAETPLFVFLAPPVFGLKYLDFCVSGLYKLIGYLMRWDPFGRLMGRIVYNIDRMLRAVGIRTPNHSLLVIRNRS